MGVLVPQRGIKPASFSGSKSLNPGPPGTSCISFLFWVYLSVACWVLTVCVMVRSCGGRELLVAAVRASHRDGVSCSGAQALGHRGFGNRGHGLVCLCGTWDLADQGPDLRPLHCRPSSYPPDHQGSPSRACLILNPKTAKPSLAPRLKSLSAFKPRLDGRMPFHLPSW